MKVFISVDIEGINGICCWDETDPQYARYHEFKEELQKEVNAACLGANEAGATEIIIKDAHDSARNLNITDLPENVTLIRGWEGGVCSMMAGLTKDVDAVMFVGYHSPSRSDGNSLSHTMNTRIHHVKINGQIASEFMINSYYASTLGVPVAFLSGDENLTKLVKSANHNITTVASKKGMHGACVSKHPSITHKEIKEGAKEGLQRCTKDNIVELPKHFDVEIQYKNHLDAFRNSFFPGCKLSGTDKVIFSSDNYYDVLVMLKFIL